MKTIFSVYENPISGMDRMKALWVFLLVCVIASCTHNVEPGAPVVVSSAGSGKDRVEGRWGLVISNLNRLDMKVYPHSRTCSANSFRVDIRKTFEDAVLEAAQSRVEEVVLMGDKQPKDQLSMPDMQGVIFVSVTEFAPAVSFQYVPALVPADGRVSIAADVQIQQSAGQTTDFRIAKSQSATTKGVFCTAGQSALANASSRSIRELMIEFVDKFDDELESKI